MKLDDLIALAKAGYKLKEIKALEEAEEKAKEEETKPEEATTEQPETPQENEPPESGSDELAELKAKIEGFEKEKEDLTFETALDENENVLYYMAWFRLTQEEANSFCTCVSKSVKVQVRALTTNGEALASDKFTFGVDDVLNDEVLT